MYRIREFSLTNTEVLSSTSDTDDLLPPVKLKYFKQLSPLLLHVPVNLRQEALIEIVYLQGRQISDKEVYLKFCRSQVQTPCQKCSIYFPIL